MDAPSEILKVNGLTVSYHFGEQWLNAVRDFSICIEKGQTYGLVGESGSGKSTVALAIIRHLSENGHVDDGSVLFDNLELISLPLSKMRQIWGSLIAMVPQDPLSSLNPSLQVGEQIAEIIRQHNNASRQEAELRSIELLRSVHIADPDRVARSYPHQISGGMQQRVLIAMALSTDPKLLILDEPTTGLDVTTQAAILDLFRELIVGQQTAALYVTHNLGVVAQLCHRVAVLYAGELVEDAVVADLFHNPWHPYTEGLLQSVPKVGGQQTQVELRAIPGDIPSLQNRPNACVFAPRCSLAIDRCSQERPPLEVLDSGRRVRCFRWAEMASGEISVSRPQEQFVGEVESEPTLENINELKPILKLDELEIFFNGPRSMSDFFKRRPGDVIKAVDGVSLRLNHGQVLGIVGESGSGKTTLARSIVGLVNRTGGSIELYGTSLPPDLNDRPLQTRRLLQYIFQNPEEALNPHLTIGQTLSRPLITLLKLSQGDANSEVVKLLQLVRLPAEYASRYPNQLSGGEKQRVAIARSFASSPDLLLADEPVSALDVSVQASILNLLLDLLAEHQNTLVFISHNLGVVGYIADVIAVMYLGQIMEIADSHALFEAPYHPYTEALLSAVPSLDPEIKHEPIRLQGEVPSQTDLPSGCPFHPRCPRNLGEICATERPPWRQTAEGARIFCHIPLDELNALQTISGII